MITLQELNKWTNEQLVKEGYRLRSLLLKRKRRLEEAIAKNPGEYSPFGLIALTDSYDEYGNMKTGIPKVSVNQHRGALKSNVLKLMELAEMKTTTARGAKADMNEKVKLALNLPTKGRLNSQQYREFKSGRQFFIDNPNALSDFYRAFEYYKEQVKHLMLDSKQELEEFSEYYKKHIQRSGYQQIEDMYPMIEKLAEKRNEEEQRKATLIPRQRRTGGFR